VEIESLRNHASYDTMAAACAAVARYDEAIRWQQMAIEQAPDGLKRQYETRLGLYQSDKPYRASLN
jgi:hypothetical protein